ncbi:TetR/AcrR family transcriptional regulator [Paracoccus aestuariivivens]|uniref:TetR family transcriptional regulator n=1 Tax=Paracoccus aestuariivivens TaxID=1820333 RepID=A0A6L6J844_9RHOB|nr:TetR/AcrR family transcriptional regulator [Paracoccus aestuariivivens]MTH78130.1 TetR family transcriptional regulator [Paracoccus aestuariivivens]
MDTPKKSESTRLTILQAGETLVKRKGFAALGLQEILVSSGVPKGSFYHYFASKEAFGVALLQRYVSEYGVKLEPLLSEGSGRERLMRYFRGWIAEDNHAGEPGQTEDCLVVKLAAEVSDLSEDMRQVLSDGTEALIARLADIIRDGRKDGSLSPAVKPKALAQTLYQMWLGAALLARLTRSAAPFERALTATERLLDCDSDD